MRKLSPWRKFRRRLRAITCGEWFFILIVFNMGSGIYKSLFVHPKEDIQWEMSWYCEKEAQKAFSDNQIIKIQEIRKANPISDKHSKEWLYIGEARNDKNQGIGVIFCDWYDPKLDQWGVREDRPPKVKVRKYLAQP